MNKMKQITFFDLFNSSELLITKSLNSLKSINKNKFKKIKVTVISSYTTDYLCENLKLLGLIKNINFHIYKTPFGSLKFLINDPKNNIWSNDSDFYLLIPSLEILEFVEYSKNNKNNFNSILKKEINLFLKKIQQINKKPIILSSIPFPFATPLGISDSTHIEGVSTYLKHFNSTIILEKVTNLYFLDMNLFFSKFEDAFCNEKRLFFLAKQPFNFKTTIYLSLYFINIIVGIMGMTKKVLITDLDNTLWGGIVGDLGYDKIQISNTDPKGEAFIFFQQYLKNLSNNGILLCVCSKNQRKIALEPFNKNKSMLLRKKDFSIFKANYNDKASNIKDISKELNLPLDSFIFVDDNIIECEQVKLGCPGIEVVHLGDDPFKFVDKIENEAFFYFGNITKDDKNRIKNYKSIININKKFSQINTKSNIDSFLNSLKTKIYFEKVSKNNIERCLQLLNKTNQFKINSNIVNPKQLLSNSYENLAVSLVDKFQHYGIISFLFFNLNLKKKTLEINNWVMSCRVFSRRVEYFIIEYLLNNIYKNKIKFISFKLEITKKNTYLIDFFNKLFNLSFKKNNTYIFPVDKLNLKINKYIDYKK